MKIWKRTYVVLWMWLYIVWCVGSSWLREQWRGQEVAAWMMFWFVPTMVAGAIAGLMALAVPNRWTFALFGLVSLIHIAVGLGFHPK